MVQTIHDGAQFVNVRCKNGFERLSGKCHRKCLGCEGIK